MSEIRIENEKMYESQKTENDSLTNAELCETIADDNFMWHVEESVYWTKKALKIREKIDGKNFAPNISYYEKIINLLMEKGSYKEALKWCDKAKKLTEKLKMSNLSIIIYYAEIYFELESATECIKYGDSSYDILMDDSFERTKSSFKIANRLLLFYANYIIYYDDEKTTYNKLMNCIELTLQIAQKFYGDISIETAVIYKEKAVYLDISKQEKLAYLKKSLIIVLSIGENTELALEIFYQIRRCWPESESLEEGFKWVYENISKQFILEVLPEFSNENQKKLKDLLQL